MRKFLLIFLPLIIFLFISKHSKAQAEVDVTSIGGPSSACSLSSGELIAVFVKNIGTTNLTNVPFNLFFTINGGPPQMETDNINPFVINGVAGHNFTAHLVDMSAPGTYNIKVYTDLSINPTDTLYATVTNQTSVGGTVSPNRTVCAGAASGLLTLSGYTGPANPNIIRWESSTNAGGWPWTNRGNGHFATFNPLGALAVTTYFRAIVQNVGAGCTADSSSIDTITVNPIPLLSSTLLTGSCTGADFTYTATSATPGATFTWTRFLAGLVTDTGSASGGWNPMLNIFTNSGAGFQYIHYNYVTTANGCTNSGENVWIRVDVVPPGPSGVITGVTPVCQSTLDGAYSVAAISEAAWYNWAYDGTGASFTSGSRFTNINFSGSATSGNVSVSGGNYCGNGAVSPDYPVVVELAAISIAGGPNSVCQSATPAALTLSGASIGGGASTGAWSITTVCPGCFLSSVAQTATPGVETFTPGINFKGPVTLRLTTDDPGGVCGPVFSDRTIMVDTAAIAIAGAPNTFCQSTIPYTFYLKNGASVGGPAAIKGAWSILPPAFGSLSTLADTTKPDSVQYTTPGANFGGTVTLRLTTTDPGTSCGIVTSDRIITFDSLAVSVPGGRDTACQSAATVVTLTGAYVKGGATTGRWESGGSLPGHGVLSSVAYQANAGIASTTYTFAANFVGTDTIRLITNDITLPSVPPWPPGPAKCHIDTAYRYLTVDSIAIAIAGGPSKVCQSATPAKVTLNGAYVKGGATLGQWEKVGGASGTLSPLTGFQPNNGIDTTKYTPAPNFAGIDTLRLISNDISTRLCHKDTSYRYIVIDSLAKSVAGGPNSVCQSPFATIVTLSGAYVKGGADMGQWERVGGAGGALFPLVGYQNNAGIASTTYTLTPNFVGTDTLRLVTNDTTTPLCHIDTSYRYITATPFTVGGTVGNEAIVCSGANGDTLTLTQYQYGIIKHWQYSINGGVNWINTVNPTAKQGYSNIVTTTWYRAVVEGACDSAFSVEARITVDSHPFSVGGTSLKNDTVCSGSNLDTLRLSGNLGKIIRWESSSDGGNNWVYVNDTTNRLIYQNLTTTTIYHAVSLNSACGSANSTNDTITVGPSPVVTNLPTASTCSGAGPAIALAASTPSTFSWTIGIITGAVTGASPGVGATINQVLTNPSNSVIGTVEYIVTATSTTGLCLGAPFTITVSVNPIPAVTNAAVASGCSGAGPNVSLTASAPSTFAWTIGTITGGILGTSPSSGATINQTLTNPSNSLAGTVEYIVTPTSTTGLCVGLPFTITITVNPAPTITNAATANTCSGISPNIILVSSVVPSTFTWTIGTITGSIIGASAGSGAIINQPLNNLSNSASGTVDYIVTPTSTTGTCAGTPFTITVTIDPTPAVTNLATANTCDGVSPNIGLTSSTPSTFTWTIGTITGGITGASLGLGATINQVLTNPSNSTAGTVEYIVTPTSTTASLCVGAPYTITVTVNPTPVITNAAVANACSGAVSNIALTSSAPSTFAWTIGPITGGITGASASSGATISQILTNPSNSVAGTVDYLVTPTSATGSCIGAPFTITVTVNPAPTVTNAATANTCSGAGPNISLVSSVLPSTFSWTIGTISGSIIGASAGTGSTINQPLNNLSNSANGTVDYIVTPTSTAGSCTGIPFTITVTVYPSPKITNALTANACSGSGPNISLTASTPSTFTWTIGTITGGITGASAGGPSATINQVLTNPSNLAAGTVEYIVTPTAVTGSCVGATFTITVTVNPTPLVTNAATASICNGAGTNIGLTSSAPSTFTWTVGIITGAITGASGGAGGTINQTLLNPSNSLAGTVQYNVTPTSITGSCAGPVSTITVTVNPTPVVTNAPALTICGGTSPNIILTSSAAGNFSWTVGTITGGINGASSGVGTTINDILINPSSSVAGTVAYIVTSTSTTGSCASTPFTITVTVNAAVALPVFTLGALSARCQGAGVVSYAAPNNTGTTYTLSAAGTSSIVAATGVVTWDANYNGTATITASATGCNGTLTAIHTVTITPITVGGVLSGTTIVCTGINSGALTLSGEIGNISRWESSTDAGTTWTTILPNNTTALQTYTNLIDTTWYRVIVTSGSCGSATSSIGIITVDPPSVGGAVTPNYSLCAGANNGVITLNGSIGTVLRWEYSTDGGFTWVYINNTSNTQTFTNPLLTTIYHAVVQNGVCSPSNSFNDTITVNPHSVAGSLSSAFPGCAYANGGALTLTGYVGTITWQYSTNGGVNWRDTTGSTATQVYTNLPDTTLYRVRVQSGTCAADTSLPSTIIIYPKPNAVFKADTVCFGTATAFVNTSTVASGFIQFNQWDFGDNGSSLSVNPTHTYSLAGVDTVKLFTTSNYGCLDTVIHPVLVNPLPSTLITQSGPLSFCCGDSVTLSAVAAGMNYAWTPAATPPNSQSIKVKDCTAGGSYHVTVTNPFTTCFNSSPSVTVVIFPLPVAFAGNDTTISLGNSIILHGQGGLTYSWSPITGLSNPAIASPIATPKVTTTHELTVTDINGCIDKDTMTITVIVDYNVIVSNLMTTNGDGFNDFWLVKNIENYPGTEAIVVNREGQQVFYSSSYDNTWDGTRNGKALPDGTYYYFIKFQNSDKIYKGPITILNEKK